MSHIALAEMAARESMVLLKNSNNTLPINRRRSKKIAVIGANVTFTRAVDAGPDTAARATARSTSRPTSAPATSGRAASSHDPAKATGPFDGIMAGAPAPASRSRRLERRPAAADADFVVVVAGLTPEDEGEEYTGAGDRTSGAPARTPSRLGLDPKQNSGVQNGLITAVAALGKPMVVVLEGGSVIDMMPWYANVPAVVMAWYPGMVGGTRAGQAAVRRRGTLAASCRSPGTRTVTHWPTFAATRGTTTMDYCLGYRWYFDKNGDRRCTPAAGSFPFGYGLSYTTFSYSNLQVPCATVAKDGVVNVTVDVTNTGTVAGAEIVFVFVSYPGSAVGDPRRQLQGAEGLPPDRPDHAGAGRARSDPAARQGPQVLGQRLVQLEGRDRHGEGDRGAERRRGRVHRRTGPNCALSDTFMVN